MGVFGSTVIKIKFDSKKLQSDASSGINCKKQNCFFFQIAKNCIA